MKKFNIEFIHDDIREIDYGDTKPLVGLEGRITIGDYENTFYLASGSLWTYEEYKQQWKNAIERLKTHDRSCLVLAIRIVEKYKRPCMTLYLLHKVNDTVFFGRQLISTDLTKGLPAGPAPAYSQTCYQLVDDRIENEKGEAIDHNGYELWEKGISVEDFFGS